MENLTWHTLNFNHRYPTATWPAIPAGKSRQARPNGLADHAVAPSLRVRRMETVRADLHSDAARSATEAGTASSTLPGRTARACPSLICFPASSSPPLSTLLPSQSRVEQPPHLDRCRLQHRHGRRHSSVNPHFRHPSAKINPRNRFLVPSRSSQAPSPIASATRSVGIGAAAVAQGLLRRPPPSRTPPTSPPPPNRAGVSS